jgi:siroheme synthase
MSQSFAIVTGHCNQGRAQDWKRYAAVDTLVILMGVQNRAFIAQSLIAAGRKASEPVAFLEWGTFPSENIIESTLAEIAKGNAEVHSPAVFVIGDVVRLRAQLSGNRPAMPARPAAISGQY